MSLIFALFSSNLLTLYIYIYILYHSHTAFEASVSSTRETSPPLAPPRFFLVPRSAASFSKPNPKRAERHPHYHSCSRQRKVCLVSVLFRHPTTFDADTVGAHTWVGEDIEPPTSHPAVMLYEFRALCTLISGTGVGFPREICIRVCVCISVCSRRWHRPIACQDMNQRECSFFLYTIWRRKYRIGYSCLFFFFWNEKFIILKFYRHFFFSCLTRLEKDRDKLNISLENISVCHRMQLILNSRDRFNLIFWRTKSNWYT